jgi:hypothetical protein
MMPLPKSEEFAVLYIQMIYATAEGYRDTFGMNQDAQTRKLSRWRPAIGFVIRRTI